MLPLVVILGIFTAIEYRRHQKGMLDNLTILASQTSLLIENSLQQSMLSSNWTELQHTLDSIGENDMLSVVYLLDRSGWIVFAPNGNGVGTRLDNSHPTCQSCHMLPAVERPSSVVVTLPDGRRVFRSMNPIENREECQTCHNAGETFIGLLLTDISMAPLESPLAADLIENLLWRGATILVVLIVANLAISQFVLRRLQGLATAISEFGQGQIYSPLPESSNDEIGLLTRAYNAMTRRLTERESENRILSESLRHQSAQRGKLLKRLITAQEDERKRVARELHDELGQSLAGLSFQSEAIEGLIKTDPDRALEQLTQTRSLIDETTEKMYDLILALRPSSLDDLGLIAALQAHAERLLSANEITFHIDSSGLKDRLPPAVETNLYRIFQEALTNVVRHSEAKHVRIQLIRNDGIFEGEIADDGRGFAPETVMMNGSFPAGLGLLGMQERVRQCGGEIKIVSQAGEGTRIYVRIPLREDECE